MEDCRDPIELCRNSAFFEKVGYNRKLQAAFVVALCNERAFLSELRDVGFTPDHCPHIVPPFERKDQGLEPNVARDTGDLIVIIVSYCQLFIDNVTNQDFAAGIHCRHLLA